MKTIHAGEKFLEEYASLEDGERYVYEDGELELFATRTAGSSIVQDHYGRFLRADVLANRLRIIWHRPYYSFIAALSAKPKETN